MSTADKGCCFTWQRDCNLHVVLTSLLPREGSRYKAVTAAINERLREFGQSKIIKGIDFLDCGAEYLDKEGNQILSYFDGDAATLNRDGALRFAMCIDKVSSCGASDHRRLYSLPTDTDGTGRLLQFLGKMDTLQSSDRGEGRNIYAEVKGTTVFQEVDLRISAMPAPPQLEACKDWESLEPAEGSSDRKELDKEWLEGHQKFAKAIGDFGQKVSRETALFLQPPSPPSRFLTCLPASPPTLTIPLLSPYIPILLERMVNPWRS